MNSEHSKHSQLNQVEICMHPRFLLLDLNQRKNLVISVESLKMSLTYSEFFWAYRYTHRTHEGTIMVGPEKFLKFVPPDILRKHFLALSVIRFFYKAFSKLLKLSLRKTLFRGWFLKKFIYSNNKITVSLWELRSDLSLQYAANSTKWITRSKVNTHVIYYVVKLITLSLTVSSFASTSLFICFPHVWIFVFSVISK